jgi:hypothetical protein
MDLSLLYESLYNSGLYTKMYLYNMILVGERSVSPVCMFSPLVYHLSRKNIEPSKGLLQYVCMWHVGPFLLGTHILS